MTDVRERLSRLIELASGSAPEKQTALAFELCDLLIDWPERYPSAMREPFEALLEKVRQRLDEATRSLIAQQLSAQTGIAVTLLNEFYFDAPVSARRFILARNAVEGVATATEGDRSREAQLIKAARAASGREFADAFARALGLPLPTAQAILGDESGDALAVTCKGAKITRTAYSALVVLLTGVRPTNAAALYDRLAQFDSIPESGACRLVAHWRREPNAPAGARAA